MIRLGFLIGCSTIPMLFYLSPFTPERSYVMLDTHVCLVGVFFIPKFAAPSPLTRLINQIVKALVNNASRLKMSQHLSRRKQPPHRRFGRIADIMADIHRQVAVHFHMQFDKYPIATVAGADIMHTAHAFAA